MRRLHLGRQPSESGYCLKIVCPLFPAGIYFLMIDHFCLKNTSLHKNASYIMVLVMKVLDQWVLILSDPMPPLIENNVNSPFTILK